MEADSPNIWFDTSSLVGCPIEKLGISTMPRDHHLANLGLLVNTMLKPLLVSPEPQVLYSCLAYNGRNGPASTVTHPPKGESVRAKDGCIGLDALDATRNGLVWNAVSAELANV